MNDDPTLAGVDTDVSTEEEGRAPESTSGDPPLAALLESVLLVVDEPVTDIVLAQTVDASPDVVRTTLRELANEYTNQGRGFELRQVAGGWRLYTRAECAWAVERFVREGQRAKLSQAALETLAVVAYRQPVTRSRVSAIRGVNVDGVMRTLALRGLVEEDDTDGEHGAARYRTTAYFLERLGLPSLDDLPDLAPYLPDNTDELEEVGG